MFNRLRQIAIMVIAAVAMFLTFYLANSVREGAAVEELRQEVGTLATQVAALNGL